MPSLDTIRSFANAPLVCVGLHRPIIQSILDFDYLSGIAKPRIAAIIGSGRACERFFWGRGEIALPVVSEPSLVHDREDVRFFVNVSSGRRTLDTMYALFESFPGLIAGSCFAENVPEQHALELGRLARERNVLLSGPASVGVLIGGALKLGAIGGVDPLQITSSRLSEEGTVAVFSSSGGMTNELISTVASLGGAVSFAIAFGGDRFPAVSPAEAFLLAEDDHKTRAIIYFGELGGEDEYEIADLFKKGRITKSAVCYIAGTIENALADPMQFGHAKALSQSRSETADAKRAVLSDAGLTVADSYGEFLERIGDSVTPHTALSRKESPDLSRRVPALFSSHFSGDARGAPQFAGHDLIQSVQSFSYPEMIACALLGRRPKSAEFTSFLQLSLKLLADHGPQVSGAVNTIITARAGKDLVSALCSGLLTIGDRFGGAITGAAREWLSAVESGVSPHEFVERFARKHEPIPGIGHKKYSRGEPDPRITCLEKLLFDGSLLRYTRYAREIEKITLGKKSNLIINIDGFIAGALLDLLVEKEGYSAEELSIAIESGMFNALFVLARSVGFVGHYLDQRRHDEGLFRLPERDIALL